MHRQQEEITAPLTIFISYAHEDEALCNELEKHLSLLQRQGIITAWYDRQIVPGANWSQAIDSHLNAASLILLLISPDFLASDYCYNIETPRALERHNRGEARVIPIILRPCDWRDAPFGQLQCLPRDGKSITEWDNQDAAFRDIVQGLRRAIEQRKAGAHSVPRLAPFDRQNRMRLLKRVRATWIEGVLEHSLHQAAPMALDLQEQPDALANPWRLEVQETNLPSRPLPAGTSIARVYDEADGELLILGEAGAGKTTLLLELACELITRAEQNETLPMPVVFHLSSWAEKQPPLAHWLVEELESKYQVPRTVGQAWIAQERVLPLLDGLDEMKQEALSACIAAVNAYRAQYRQIPPVVCSRAARYFAQEQRLTLLRAVTIRPLTAEQIDAYLAGTGGQLEAVREALRDDPDMQKLVATPLMLSVLTLAYQGNSVEALVAESSPKKRMFATYVQRMLQRRGTQTRYTPSQTIHWLAWLAKQLIQHNQTGFYIERMQPDWLSLQSRSYQMYRILVRLVAGFLIGISIGPPVGLLYGPFIGTLAGLMGWLLGGLIGWLFSLIVYQSGREIKLVEIVTWSGVRLQGELMVSSRMRFVGGIFSASVGLLTGGLFIGLIAGPVAGLIGGSVVSVFCVLFAWLCMSLLGGLSSRMLSEHDRITPNQGIHRSVRNSILVGLCFGLIFGLVTGLGIGLVSVLITKHPASLSFELSFGLCGGLVGAVGAAMPRGGLASIQHYLLRLLLWRVGAMPLNYMSFLDYAAEHILLYKVGGGYIFMHHLLLDYFASLDAP